MDIHKIKKISCIFLIIITALLLYHEPLFSNKPLGLDTMGHLSKVVYLKEFGMTQWDMSWYNGEPFLKYYPPFYYYFVGLFKNLFFGSNLACFLSIILCSIGIFLIVNFYTKRYVNALISALFFLSVICVPYYWIVVGNQPFLLGIWAIPFSLFFFEKSLDKRIYFLSYSATFLIGLLSHILIGMCIAFIVFIRIFFLYGLSIKKLTRGMLFILIPIGLSSFWLIPFLEHSSSFVGEEPSYHFSLGSIPQLIIGILGFGNKTSWGIGDIGVGLSLLVFVFLLFLWQFKKTEYFRFLLVIFVIFSLLSLGILGKYYPSGISQIRFMPISSIFLCCLIGVCFPDNDNRFYILIIPVLIFSLFYNQDIISINYNEHSYCCNDIKYGKFANIYDEFYNLSFINSSNNFRFGDYSLVPFSKSLNYVFPYIPQTRGYYDQGILYNDTFTKMIEGIWYLNDTNVTMYYLDWFAIRYFELSGGYLDSEWKFNNSYFRFITQRNTIEYPYKIYEYKNATKIVSVIKTNFVSFREIGSEEIDGFASLNYNTKKIVPFASNKKINITNNYEENEFKLNRRTPDYIEIESEFDGKNAVLFKESYFPGWKATEYPSKRAIPVYKTANDMMLIIPSKESKKVVIYYALRMIDYLSILLSTISIIFLYFFVKRS